MDAMGIIFSGGYVLNFRVVNSPDISGTQNGGTYYSIFPFSDCTPQISLKMMADA